MGVRLLLIAGGHDNHPHCWLSADPALSPFPAPQIRKAAQHGVCSILKGSEFMFGEKAPAHHPAAISTAKFCIQEIEKSGGGAAQWEWVGRGWGQLQTVGWSLSCPLSARLQGGHHHVAHADPAEGPTALLPRRPGEELQRDSPAGHDLKSCGELVPQCMGHFEEEGRQSFRPRPACWHSGGSLFRPKAGVGVSWPRPCSWLHPKTHLIPGVGQTGQPQLGDELREGVESGGTGEAAVLPCLNSAPPPLMVIFFSLSPSSFAYLVRSV